MNRAHERRERGTAYNSRELYQIAAHFAQQYTIKERRAWLQAESRLHRRNDKGYYGTLGTFLADWTVVRKILTKEYLNKAVGPDNTNGTKSKRKQIIKWIRDKMKRK